MDEAGKKRLLEEYAANKRPETREQLILEYAPLVKAVAGRLSMYLGYNVDYDDGSNCIDWSLGVTWRFAEHYTLSGSVNYSQAATVLRRRDAGDEFWVGFRLGVEF